MKYLSWIIIALIAFALAACASSKDVVTDGDRQLEDQSLKGVKLVGERLDLVKIARAKLVELRTNTATATVALEAAEIDVDQRVDEALALAGVVVPVVRANLEQLQTNHGPPEKPAPFDPKKSQEERERSQREHAAPGWLYLLIGAAVAGTLTAAVGKIAQWAPTVAPLLALIPGVGPWVSLGLAAVEGIARVRKTVADKANGATTPVPVTMSESELLAPLAKSGEDHKVGSLLKGVAHVLEEKLFGERL